jgi:hypothetical protein
MIGSGRGEWVSLFLWESVGRKRCLFNGNSIGIISTQLNPHWQESDSTPNKFALQLLNCMCRFGLPIRIVCPSSKKIAFLCVGLKIL